MVNALRHVMQQNIKCTSTSCPICNSTSNTLNHAIQAMKHLQLDFVMHGNRTSNALYHCETQFIMIIRGCVAGYDDTVIQFHH